MNIFSFDRPRPTDHCGESFGSSADGAIVAHFGAAARSFADRLAIQDCAVSLSYAELAAMVARIAGLLADAVAGRPGPVAILLDAEARYPVAMLAALGGGRAYVPLDAAAPVDRNRAIVADTGVCAIVAAGDLLRDARAMAPPQAIVVDAAEADAVGATQDNVPIAAAQADDLHSILHTSGSTGAAKGIAFSHRNVLRYTLAYADTVRITSDDRVLLARPAHVQSAVRSIYGALLKGASLHILPPLRLGPAGFAQEMRARRITVFRSSPTLLRRLDEALAPGERLATIRVASIGSERVEWRDFDLCRRRFAPDVAVDIGLNSTESCGGICQWFADDAVRASCRHPPVGPVAPGWRVTLVGDDGAPVADGEVGEIVVTSRHLSLGYWRGAAQRVESFPQAADDPAARVLATGDLGRRRADGLIEFIGRSDQVIKLHGQRVDCAELETALTALCEVREAAVVVRSDESARPRLLVAYVALRSGNQGLLGRHLQAMLAQTLPAYMVPGRIVIVEALPQLPNMKIDRMRLAQVDAAQAAEAPDRGQDPLLDDIAHVFETVLELTGASADDNVASLGGDSLQAITVMTEIERRFGAAMPDEFAAEDPTIRSIAGWLVSVGRAAEPRAAGSR